MTDIVERLKAAAYPTTIVRNGDLMEEAAAEIERLMEVLKPFATHANHYDHRQASATIGGSVANGLPTSRLTVAHLRAARAAQTDGEGRDG